jgi:hypothetical protein
MYRTMCTLLQLDAEKVHVIGDNKGNENATKVLIGDTEHRKYVVLFEWTGAWRTAQIHVHKYYPCK